MTKKLFSIVSQDLNESRSKITSHIELNPKHPVFGGHFPGQPILPGVYMLDMIKESLIKAGHTVNILSNNLNIKYLHPVNPNENVHLNLEIEIFNEADKLITAKSSLSDSTVHFKFKGSYI